MFATRACGKMTRGLAAPSLMTMRMMMMMRMESWPHHRVAAMNEKETSSRSQHDGVSALALNTRSTSGNGVSEI